VSERREALQPRFYTVDDRPIRIVPTPDGGLARAA
jgi:hypothetical protein